MVMNKHTHPVKVSSGKDGRAAAKITSSSPGSSPYNNGMLVSSTLAPPPPSLQLKNLCLVRSARQTARGLAALGLVLCADCSTGKRSSHQLLEFRFKC